MNKNIFIQVPCDNTPVVGHVKGVVHYASGDKEHDNQCMIESTRQTLLFGVSFLTGGLGYGVVATGMAYGLAVISTNIAYDGVHSAVDSIVHNEHRTHGIWHLDKVIQQVNEREEAQRLLSDYDDV